jgi:hypothetical protein
MLVAVCSAYTLALDPALEVRAIHSASKSQWSSSLRVKENMLLVNSPFKCSLLTRTLVMTSDSATLLRNLHDLGAVPAIRPFGVDRPVASDIGWWLLRHNYIGGREQQECEAGEKQLRAVFPQDVLQLPISIRLHTNYKQAIWLPTPQAIAKNASELSLT